MEWASLSAFYMRGIQGISKFLLERNKHDNDSVLSLIPQPHVQCKQGSSFSMELTSLTWLMT